MGIVNIFWIIVCLIPFRKGHTAFPEYIRYRAPNPKVCFFYKHHKQQPSNGLHGIT